MLRALRLAAAMVLAACGDAPDLVIALDPTEAGAPIPDDFLGASYETSTLIGGAYFAPGNAALRRTIATLGLAHLRIGGNEADTGPQPTAADVAAFTGFATAADLPAIYTLRLATDDPAAAATVARQVLATGAVDCLAIGNEPSFYLADYPTYAAAVRAYMAAIADPRARYCGPDVLGSPDWVARFAADFAPASANVHFYYGDGTAIAAADARDQLLSPALLERYAADRAALAPRVRISEANSFYSGGCPGASDAFASALWGLDYLWWWAAHEAAGIDLHTGDHVSGASTTYALFTTAGAGYHVHPLGYAVVAFALAGHGRRVPVALASDAVTAYAALAADGHLWLTLVNKTHDAASSDLAIGVRPGPGFASARAWRLAAGGDVAARDGVTLGGAPIADDGSWAGAPETTAFSGELAVTLPAASAVVIALDPP